MVSWKASLSLSTSILQRTLQKSAGSVAAGDAGPAGFVIVCVDLSDPGNGKYIQSAQHSEHSSAQDTRRGPVSPFGN